MLSLRIATFNLLNLARAGHQCYPELAACSSAQYAARIEWFAEIFGRIDADVLLLQEVFHSSALNDLVDRMPGNPGYRAWVTGAGPENVKPRLALLSRLPLLGDPQSIEAFPAGDEVPLPGGGSYARFSRPLMKARVLLPDGSALTVINTHFKSRMPRLADGHLPDDPGALARGQLRSLYMRGAEAVALRQIVIDALRERDEPLIVGGDFNSSETSVPAMIVAGDPASPLALRHAAEACVDSADAERGPTARDAGNAVCIDHLMVSVHFMADAAQRVATVKRVEIFDDHMHELERASQADDTPQSAAQLPLICSDHAAVCATIVFDKL